MLRAYVIFHINGLHECIDMYRYIYFYVCIRAYMGVSENSVPLNPMVNDHYPY